MADSLSHRPALSVLVPAFNAASFVQDTLDSITRQTYANFRAWVSVDPSADDTAAICREHARRDPRFEVICPPTRLGWVGNSNALLRLADSAYAVFAFHDDVLLPTYFEKLVGALDAHPEAAVAFSDATVTHVDGRQQHWVYSELDGIGDPVARGMRLLNRTGQWWVPNRGVFRTTFAQWAGGLKVHDSGEFSADLPWLFHLSLYGPFVRVAETLCLKFYKEGSLSRSWRRSDKATYDVLASCMRELWNSRAEPGVKLQLANALLPCLRQNVGRLGVAR